jgi:acyl carrier protein
MAMINPVESQSRTNVGSQHSDAKEAANKQLPTAMEIRAWLVSYLSELLEIDSNTVCVNSPFDRFGLDSAGVVVMTGDIEDWLGCELHPTLAYDYPTIDSLAMHLAEECNAKALSLD